MANTKAAASDQFHYYKAITSPAQSDPTLFQGWALNPGTAPGSHIPVTTTPSYYAWRVTDSVAAPQNYNAGYASTLGTAWITARTQGWRFVATARYLTSPGQGPNVGLTAFVNSREYNLMLNLNATGNLQATLFDETPLTLVLPISPSAANSFHDFELKSVGNTASVQLYLDGTLINPTQPWDGYPNPTHGEDTMHWGNSSRAGSALGVMDYHEIVVEAGPFEYLAGDFDESTIVNGADLSRWKTGFGSSGAAATHAQGDADGDHDVDGADFLTWQRQMGLSGMATAAIPEPTGAALTLLGAVGLLRLNRRRRMLSP